MQKILSIVIVALLTVSTFAQEKQRRQHRSDLSPDQTAELQTKKMTLHLELNEKQQQQILEINKRNAIVREQNIQEHKAIREKNEKLNGEELVKRRSARLDKQIAHQKEMKKILNEKQFETWKNSRKHKAHNMKKRMRKHKGEDRSKVQRKR